MSRTRARTQPRQPPCRRQPSTAPTTRLHLWSVALLLGILIASRVNAEQGSKRGGSSAVSPSLTAGKATSSSSSHSQSFSCKQQDENESSILVVTRVLQITETEIWDGSKWKSGESRWTRPDDDDDDDKQQSERKKGAAAAALGQPCASPDKQVPPSGFKFDGEWKIVTGGSSRDSYGWEYSMAQPFPIRQRVWLRNLVAVEPKKSKKKHKTQVLKIRRKTKAAEKIAAKRRRKLPGWIRTVTDDFNFKGVGMSLYKSIVFPKSFGVAFRLPLTYNFGFWETNPGLPSVSSTIGLYFPGTAMISISTSVRLEFLKFMSARVVEIACYLILSFVWTFLRGIVLACSALAFPITRELYQPPIPMASPWARQSGPIYNRSIEERLGCSFSWRISRSKGYEFRVSYWHYYAYTLTSVWPAVQGLASLLQRQEKAAMPEWWARRKAAFGLSTSGPIPDAPFVTSSLAMSLSGYYFRPMQKVRLVASTSAKDFTTSPLPTKPIEPIADPSSRILSSQTDPTSSMVPQDLSEEDDSDEEVIEDKPIKVTKG